LLLVLVGGEVHSEAALKLAKQNRGGQSTVGGAAGGGAFIGGMATSLALTSKQGIEFVDPNAARDRLRDGTATTYFSEATGFVSSMGKRR
jgi:hypothetical protein